jgi:hypothetical protein
MNASRNGHSGVVNVLLKEDAVDVDAQNAVRNAVTIIAVLFIV